MDVSNKFAFYSPCHAILRKVFRAIRKVRIKSQLRCAFLPLNQNWVLTTFSTRDMTLIQSALNSSDPGACF